MYRSPGWPFSAASGGPAATAATSPPVAPAPPPPAPPVRRALPHGRCPPRHVVAHHARGRLPRLIGIDRNPQDVRRVDHHHLDPQACARRERLGLALVLGIAVCQAELATAVDRVLGCRLPVRRTPHGGHA